MATAPEIFQRRRKARRKAGVIIDRIILRDERE
jgi:hypothetical protein